MKAVIFDIDGTLADLAHRLHYIEQSPKDWKAFHASAVDDRPIKPIMDMCRRYLLDPDYTAFFCTGRPLSSKQITLDWFAENNVIIDEDRLLMRGNGNHKPDYVIKSAMLDYIKANGHEVEFVVEDRQSVVDMWRSYGILCLQCAKGDY